MSKINKYFDTDEFKCKCGCNGINIADMKLIDILTDVREYFHAPIFISSGYRCPKRNKEVGGASKSYHVLGKAVDFVVQGHSCNDVYAYLDAKYTSIGLINEIAKVNGAIVTWIHLDVRGFKYREVKKI